MHQPGGRNLPLSLPRRFVCDLLHFAQKIPTVPVERRMHLAPVVAARQAAAPRPSWCAIFTKAYGLVAARHPELRRAYLSFPRPHLYESAINVASIAIGRRFGDEYAVFPARIRSPEQRSLRDLDTRIRELQHLPIESIGGFRHVLKISALPRPLRRLVWWTGLNLSGRKRSHCLGTFGVSVYGSLGAASLHPLSPLTTTLNTGIFSDDGSVEVRVVYDHRVMDGPTVARALADLEEVLGGAILNELRYLKGLEAA